MNEIGEYENIKFYVNDEQFKKYKGTLEEQVEKLQAQIDKAIEYIETHQLDFKSGTTTFGSERLSMEERKLIDILKGDIND